MTLLKQKKILFCITLSILFLCLSGMGLAAELTKVKPLPTGNNHALFIGINNYKHWPKLKSPATDAEAIAKILSDKYDFRKENIVFLTDNSKDKPTAKNIISYLEKYLNELTEKDNLLIFFSGHSIEDEDGETYWIPIDGKEDSKTTWLNHSTVVNQYLDSDILKAKHLLIITDTLFSEKLIQRGLLTVVDLNLSFEEMIFWKASHRAREVIAFDDQHWPGNKNTNDMGLFAYYIHKALKENLPDIITIVDLICDEKVSLPIRKIAGTSLTCNRLKRPEYYNDPYRRLESPPDYSGSFIIKKVPYEQVAVTSKIVGGQGRTDETLGFKMVARNENNFESGSKTASFTVVAKRYALNSDGTVTDQFTQKPRDRFVDNKDGTVTDLYTSLMWLKTPNQIALTYQKARDYCRNLKEGGHTGWRLPTINELRRISDSRQQNPALPLGHTFTGVITDMLYWSKTKHLSTKAVKAIDMYRGKVRYNVKHEKGIAWPVRCTQFPE